MFYIRVQLIKSVVLVACVWQSDSVIHTHAHTLLLNIKQSSLSATVGPCWLSIFNTAECTCQSQTPLGLTHIHLLVLCIKQISNENILYSTGKST